MRLAVCVEMRARLLAVVGVTMQAGTALSRPIYLGAANAAGATGYPCQCYWPGIFIGV